MTARRAQIISGAALALILLILLTAALHPYVLPRRPTTIAVIALAAIAVVVERIPVARRRPVIRTYQIRLYDGDYELLAGRQHLVVLDLDGPAWPAILAERLTVLMHHAQAGGEYARAPRLEVWDGGRRVLDWAGMPPC